MNNVPSNVLSVIPNTTAVPNDTRLAAPAPVANTNGMTPNIKAKEVIKIGRNLTRPASIDASVMDLPAAR